MIALTGARGEKVLGGFDMMMPSQGLWGEAGQSQRSVLEIILGLVKQIRSTWETLASTIWKISLWDYQGEKKRKFLASLSFKGATSATQCLTETSSGWMGDESFVSFFSHGCNRGHFEAFDIAGLTHCPTILNISIIKRYILVPTSSLFSNLSEMIIYATESPCWSRQSSIGEGYIGI